MTARLWVVRAVSVRGLSYLVGVTADRGEAQALLDGAITDGCEYAFLSPHQAPAERPIVHWWRRS